MYSVFSHVPVRRKNCRKNWQKLAIAILVAVCWFAGFPAWGQQKIRAKGKADLQRLVAEGIRQFGLVADLNYIDTSEVTDMSELFYGLLFNGDISGWDVSKVKNMNAMFALSEFNADISR